MGWTRLKIVGDLIASIPYYVITGGIGEILEVMVLSKWTWLKNSRRDENSWEYVVYSTRKVTTRVLKIAKIHLIKNSPHMISVLSIKGKKAISTIVNVSPKIYGPWIESFNWLKCFENCPLCSSIFSGSCKLIVGVISDNMKIEHLQWPLKIYKTV